MTATHISPAPWSYEFRPYTSCQETGEPATIPAFEINDAEGEKIFDSNENLPADQQELNCRYAARAPELCSALEAVLPYAEAEAFSLDRHKDSPEAAAAAKSAWQAIHAAQALLGDLASPSGNKPYSVLLLYPDYLDDTGYETFYALVEAADPLEAVQAARRSVALSAEPGIDIEPDDFHPLLVTQGHHASQPLWNK